MTVLLVVVVVVVVVVLVVVLVVVVLVVVLLVGLLVGLSLCFILPPPLALVKPLGALLLLGDRPPEIIRRGPLPSAHSRRAHA